MNTFNSNFKNKLAILGLNSSNSVVIGSGILDALGIRKSGDIDVVVDEATYARLRDDGHFQEEQHYGRSILVGDSFEINTYWGVLGKDQTLCDLAELLIDTLNNGLRPHLTRWRAKYEWWYEFDRFAAVKNLGHYYSIPITVYVKVLQQKTQSQR